MLLRLHDLSVSFAGIRAVDGVSLSVEAGQIFCIIGPNGAGKTTIFNLISRIYRAASGRVEFKDADITRIPAHEVAARGIARTFQNIELFEHATVLENLLLGSHCRIEVSLIAELLRLPSVRRAEVAQRRRVEEIIEFLKLEQYRSLRISGLPYGIRKTVELARALCAGPELLLLDEPSSGLNAEETLDMVYWIRDIRGRFGISVLMIEHDMQLVARVADRVLALNYGRAIAEGSFDLVQSHPDVVQAYLGG